MNIQRTTVILAKASSGLDFIRPLIAMDQLGPSPMHWTIFIWGFSIWDLQGVTKGSYTFLTRSTSELADFSRLKGIPLYLRMIAKIRNLIKFGPKLPGRGRLSSWLENIFLNHLNIDSILKSLQADAIFFDHRTNFDHRRYTDLKRSVIKLDVPVVLTPHAPHHTGTDAFEPFLENQKIPSCVDYWMPFKFDQYGNKFPEFSENFFYSGYPGLDSAFIHDQTQSSQFRGQKKGRILFIIRKFFDKGEVKPSGHDNFAYTYQQFFTILQSIVDELQISSEITELCIKPHPATSRRALWALIREVNSGSIKIDVDDRSIYEQLNDYDQFLSLYSTTVLVPILAGKPLVYVATFVDDELAPWPEMHNLYRKLSGFYDPASRRLNDALVRSRQKLADDIEHIRAYYEDHAFDRCLSRISRKAAAMTKSSS